ncbi:AAA domain-containing protein [Modestobacter sp. DSM 44400]|uniref:MobF family relaxase n=1 Tax=Modestobacter sp. DSM 44400 TaxID=1550230 RepID=UPI0008947DA6|nr:MobF family relaxase [Modestobacter sp. DSM 44400]SDY90794.1 AAA domain-containing protein [Modestobacter sp. DSM 44400]
MHGGMKVYAGSPAAARHYVEADRGRADDYYLAEGTGIARRFTAGPEGPVVELAPLTGDGYEAWVAGLDPATGAPRGWLRTDAHAVRFVEVVLNGPKSWSLAAALHPDIAAAYDAAQDRAASQIIGWLGGHATTRVGPRGGQVQVPVEVVEAVTVGHYTSRAGDPHRHLHLQINARVFAAGKWRGLHTVGVRDSLAAINGIGHAAVACDPQFRAALAAHGYALGADGEIRQLADFVGAFSARTAQITRNIDRYESEWTAAHPGEHPGPALRRAWDARAWADGRPDKVKPQPGENLTARWLAELAALGYRDRGVPVGLTPTPVGSLDREQVVERVLARLAAARSAWNPADVRGEVEQLLAAAGIVTDPAVRLELAEDLTARAMGRCVPLLNRDGVPEHIRAWTSAPVLAVEADLTARLATRATRATERLAGVPDPDLTPPPGDLTPPVDLAAVAGRLDPGQAAAVAALAGAWRLVVLEGAAGAGKTTTLAAARQALEEQGRRLVVVTPTLKAAKVAAAEVGAAAGSAARLAYEYGWRWNDDGAWTRLAAGQTDPVTGKVYAGPGEGARLQFGDLLVVDEAGMLDQDTARALLTIADECQVHLALLGDRHQLAAVGRGGVLDLAVRAVDPTAYLTLAGVHRFTCTDGGVTVPDTGYADLTLAMRAGDDPGKVFDALLARGQVRLHPDPDALRETLAEVAAASFADGRQVAVVVDTHEQAAELNAAIRDRLVTAGRVDDRHVVVTRAGERIAAGDRIATRRNDRDLGVANRDVWTVTGVDRDGGLLVTPAVTPVGRARASVTPDVTPAGKGSRVLPGDYVTAHVDLAYATTAHGAQGDTVTAAHLVVGEHTGAAAAYVGMTRGRQANTAHLVATDPAEAREQWLAVFTRDRADLGPGHATRLAAAEAARYATPRPLGQVLADLGQTWSLEQDCLDRLTHAEPRRDALRKVVALRPRLDDQLTRCTETYARSVLAAEQAAARAHASETRVAVESERMGEGLLRRWDAERDAGRQAATVLLAGPGRLGLRRAAVWRAAEELTDWADRWRPWVPQLPADTRGLAYLARGHDNRPAVRAALHTAARAHAEAAHPEHAGLRATAQAAQDTHDQAFGRLAQARRERADALGRFGVLGSAPEPERWLADNEREIAATRLQLTDARARIAQLTAEPALLAQPTDRLAAERDTWREWRDTDRYQRRAATPRPPAPFPGLARPRPEPPSLSTHRPGIGPSRGR